MDLLFAVCFLGCLSDWVTGATEVKGREVTLGWVVIENWVVEGMNRVDIWSEFEQEVLTAAVDEESPEALVVFSDCDLPLMPE